MKTIDISKVKEGSILKLKSNFARTHFAEVMQGETVTVVPNEKGWSDFKGQFKNGERIYCKYKDVTRWINYYDIEEIIKE